MDFVWYVTLIADLTSLIPLSFITVFILSVTSAAFAATGFSAEHEVTIAAMNMTFLLLRIILFSFT